MAMKAHGVTATSTIQHFGWVLCLCLGAFTWVGCGPSDSIDEQSNDSLSAGELAQASGCIIGDCSGDACSGGSECNGGNTFSFWGVTAYANYYSCNGGLIDCREFVQRFFQTAFGSTQYAPNISNICGAYGKNSVKDYTTFLPAAHYVPVPGDAVIFTKNGGGAGHGVIVRGRDSSTIYTIEQNRPCSTNGAIDQTMYHLTSSGGNPYTPSHTFQCTVHYNKNAGCQPRGNTCTSAADCCAGQGLYCMAGHCRTY